MIEFKKNVFVPQFSDQPKPHALHGSFLLDDQEAISLRDQLLAAFPIEAPKPDDTVPMRRLTKEQAARLRGAIYRSEEDVDIPGDRAFITRAIAYCLAGGEEP